MHNQTSTPFAERLSGIPESFIREILKIASNPSVISFAGGLPNPELFPVAALAKAAEKILTREGTQVLQYATTEGYAPLREYLAEKERTKSGINVDMENILILNGSQQGLDLTGKLFLNSSDPVLLEAPSYLGAIQAFSAYQPVFRDIELNPEGIDTDELREIILRENPKFFYCIPDYQNPSGTQYSLTTRQKVADECQRNALWILEDSPYGEIYFEKKLPHLFSLAPENTLLLGSFSKIISPGLRTGWVTAEKGIIRKLNIVKQASDLHSNHFAQRLLFQYLMDNDLETHLEKIRGFYHKQAERMLNLAREFFPDEIHIIPPKGGMFLWVILPEHMQANRILEKTAQEKVIFVPGKYFFTTPGKGENTFRLNFTNAKEDKMRKGMNVLGSILQEELKTSV